MDFASYVQEANEKLMVILQIEHMEGVRNISSILEVPGIDAIIIGPYDLSGSMDKLGQITDPSVQGAMETVHKSCKLAGVPIGIFALLPEQGRVYLEQGYQLLALGIDAHYLWAGAKAALQSVVITAEVG